MVLLQGCTSARACISNVYMPTTGNLARRFFTEESVREQVELVLGLIPTDIPAVLCGDFNARTAAHSPDLQSAHILRRHSADSKCCARG